MYLTHKSQSKATFITTTANISWVRVVTDHQSPIHLHLCYDSFKVNSVNAGHGQQRAVLEGVRGKRVVGHVPEAAAAHVHALVPQLADADQHHNLVPGDQQLLDARLHHLRGPEKGAHREE